MKEIILRNSNTKAVVKGHDHWIAFSYRGTLELDKENKGFLNVRDNDGRLVASFFYDSHALKEEES